MTHSAEHSTENSEKKGQNKEKVIGRSYIYAGIVIIASLSLLFYIKSLVKKDGHDKESGSPSPQTENVSTSGEEILMFEGDTPCSTNINYKFRIKTDAPINIKLAGIKEPKYYDGKNGFNVDDPGLESGMAYFENATSKKAHVKVFKVP